MKLLLERVSSENCEMMSRERSVRQQHVNLESFQGKKSETQDRLKVIFYRQFSF